MCVCVHSGTYVWVHIYVIWKPEVSIGYLYYSQNCLLRQGFPLNLELTDHPPVTNSPALIATDTSHITRTFPCVLGIQTQVSCLCNKHFADLSISPCHQPPRITFQLPHINKNVWQPLSVSDLFHFFCFHLWAANNGIQSFYNAIPLHICSTLSYPSVHIQAEAVPWIL